MPGSSQCRRGGWALRIALANWVFWMRRRGCFACGRGTFVGEQKYPKVPRGCGPGPRGEPSGRQKETCSARVENRMNSYPRPLPLIFYESDGISLSCRASGASIAGCVPFLGRLSVEPGGTVGTIQARLYLQHINFRQPPQSGSGREKKNHSSRHPRRMQGR